MSTVIFMCLLALCWQPIYLLVMYLYHTSKNDIIDKEAYKLAFKSWFGNLTSLVFAKPNV